MKKALFLGGDDGYYESSLKAGKEYEIVEPEDSDPPEDIRIIDESGKDYLYPRWWFAVEE